MAYEKKIDSRAQYWHSLPHRSYLKFLLAIFFIFSIVGFANDIFNLGRQATWKLFTDVFITGLFAALWVYCFTRKKFRLLALLIVVQIAYYVLWKKFTLGTFEGVDLQKRLLLDGSGILLMIILGFIFLVNFILTEGLQHIRYKTEIDLAKDMHNSLVPVVTWKDEIFQVYGKSIPAESLGGDIIDIDYKNSNLLCYIADVSGHGVKAGLMMGMFKTAMRLNLAENRSPAWLLAAANDTLYGLNDRSMFVTCACIRFYANQHAEFCIAGHLPILHLKSVDATVNQLLTKQIPISVKKDFAFVSQKESFRSGDLFVLLSDGLTEAHDKSKNEFGLNRIEQLVQQNKDLSLEEIFDKIINETTRFAPQQDDQSLLLIRCL